MSSEQGATVALAVASALHVGFQVTVSVLVYPALARVSPEGWTAVHGRHSRAIVPLVVVVYGALVVTSLVVLLDGPGLAALVAVTGAWGAMLVTAVAAAPTHGRLVTPEPVLLTRLLVVDRLRAVLAVVGLAGALVSLSS